VPAHGLFKQFSCLVRVRADDVLLNSLKYVEDACGKCGCGDTGLANMGCVQKSLICIVVE